MISKYKGIEFEETVVVTIMAYEGYTFEEAVLTYQARKDLPASAFCGPDKSYPAHDAAHVKNGLARLSQFGHRLNAAVRARIHACLVRRAKRFGVEVSETVSDEQAEANLKWFEDNHKELLKKGK